MDLNLKSTLVALINDTRHKHNLSLMETVVHLHERDGIEIEKLGTVIRGNVKLKAIMLEEADRLRMLKKPAN